MPKGKMDKQWHVWKVDCYSTGGGNEPVMWATTQTNVKGVTLRARPKGLLTEWFHLSDPRKRQNYSDRKQTGGCQDLRTGRGWLQRGTRESSGILFYFLSTVMLIWLSTLVKTHQPVHLKVMTFTVCKLNLNKADPAKGMRNGVFKPPQILI